MLKPKCGCEELVAKEKHFSWGNFLLKAKNFNTRSWSEVETIAKSWKCFQCSIGCLSALWETVKYLHVALLTFRPHAGGFLNRKPNSQEKNFSRFVSNLMKNSQTPAPAHLQWEWIVMFVYEKVSEIESMKHRIFRGVMSNIFPHLSLQSAGLEDEMMFD